MIENDGDIVRGLGFVALYAAYLEEQIDNLLMSLSPIKEYDLKKQCWQIKKKIKYAKSIVDLLEVQELYELSADLETCVDLFENRNVLIHGRIYAGFDRPYILKSGRLQIQEREVYSKELYDLANEFWEFGMTIYRPTLFKIPRAIRKYKARA